MSTRQLVIQLAFLVGTLGTPSLIVEAQHQCSPSDGVFQPVPLVVGKEGDGLPDKIAALGIIREVTTNQVYCGTRHLYGTARVELEGRVEGYREPSVYLVVSCPFGEAEDFVGKQVRFEAAKLTDCALVPIGSLDNRIESKGTPFYRTDGWRIVEGADEPSNSPTLGKRAGAPWWIVDTKKGSVSALDTAGQQAAVMQSIAQSHVDGNVPRKEVFESYLDRDLLAYFTSTYKQVTRVEREYLRDGPTQSGVSFPKYYLWIRVKNEDGLLAEGAVRLAAVDRERFEVTQFIEKDAASKDLEGLRSVFPGEVVDAIRKRVGGSQ